MIVSGGLWNMFTLILVFIRLNSGEGDKFIDAGISALSVGLMLVFLRNIMEFLEGGSEDEQEEEKYPLFHALTSYCIACANLAAIFLASAILFTKPVPQNSILLGVYFVLAGTCTCVGIKTLFSSSLQTD